VRAELTRIEKGIPTTEIEIPKKKPLTSREITVTFGLKKLFLPAIVVVALIIAAVVIWQLLRQKEIAPLPSEKPSIAVLPFVDLSPQKDQEHLCDGMTDEIITKLSRLKEWKVMNRTSIMRYKNTDKDVREIGLELNVTTILGGSVRKEKNVNEKRTRIDCHVYKKLTTKKREEMSFDVMIRKAESKKILGSDHSIYAKLQYLRGLRNKVHLHVIDEPTDTDWNAFQHRHLCAMAQVLHYVFTGPIFRPSQQERGYFDYLVKYIGQQLDSPDDF